MHVLGMQCVEGIHWAQLGVWILEHFVGCVPGVSAWLPPN